MAKFWCHPDRFALKFSCSDRWLLKPLPSHSRGRLFSSNKPCLLSQKFQFRFQRLRPLLKRAPAKHLLPERRQSKRPGKTPSSPTFRFPRRLLEGSARGKLLPAQKANPEQRNKSKGCSKPTSSRKPLRSSKRALTLRLPPANSCFRSPPSPAGGRNMRRERFSRRKPKVLPWRLRNPLSSESFIRFARNSPSPSPPAALLLYLRPFLLLRDPFIAPVFRFLGCSSKARMPRQKS